LESADCPGILRDRPDLAEHPQTSVGEIIWLDMIEQAVRDFLMLLVTIDPIGTLAISFR